MEKIYCVQEVLLQVKTSLFGLFDATAESLNCSLFVKNLIKTFLQFDLKQETR